MFYDTIVDVIGGTPIVRLNRISEGNIYAKLESENPGGSIKDRAAFYMIKDAESRGLLSKGGTIIEPTSGNTGIAIAMISSALGYKAVIVMPDSMSRERAEIMKAYGAEVVFTPGKYGMAGAVRAAEDILKKNNGVILGQFGNPANIMSHYAGTAKEILEDVPDVGYIVAGIGTGGTVTGLGRAMKDFAPSVKVIGVEPAESPLISSGRVGQHAIQGIGANFLPDNFDRDVIDLIVTVKGDDAISMTKRLAKEEGILAGISSGAALYAALEISRKNKGKKVVAILADRGERYMSTGIF